MLTRTEMMSILDNLSGLLHEISAPEGGPEKMPPVGGNKETDADTLKWIEMIVSDPKSSKAQEAMGNLYSKYDDKVKTAIHVGAASVPQETKDEWAGMTWKAIFKLLPDYDPKKSLFRTWISNIADTVRRRNLSKLIKSKERTGAIVHIGTRAGEDPGAAVDIPDKPQEISPFDFKAEEKKFAEELKKWLKDIEDGKEPFPFRVRPDRYPWESREDVLARHRHMMVDMFRSFYGIGVRRLNAPDFVEKYAKEEWDAETEEHRRWILVNVVGLPEGHAENLSKLSWNDLPASIETKPVKQTLMISGPRVTQYLKNWYDTATGEGAAQIWASSIGKGDLLRSLMGKITHQMGRRSTTHSIIEWAKLRELLASLVEV